MNRQSIMTEHTTTDTTTPEYLDRTRAGRRRMWFVLAICIAPVVASYFMYYVVRPQGQTNYGSLIQPQRAMPEQLTLTTLAGQEVPLAKMKGNWLLVTADSGACSKRCEDKLYWMRQLRTAMGKDTERVDRLWLLTDDKPIDPKLIQALKGTYTLKMTPSISSDIAGKWIITPESNSITDHIFLIDPQGFAMMRFPKEPDANKIKRDLTKLLRASAGWHVSKPPQAAEAAL